MEMIDSGLIDRVNDPSTPDNAWFDEQIEATIRRHPLSRPVETPYRKEWERFVGSYCSVFGEPFELHSNIDTSSVCHHVFEEDGYLYHSVGNQDPQRLSEHETGLFFAEVSGEALDFRQDPPSFRNIELRRTE